MLSARSEVPTLGKTETPSLGLAPPQELLLGVSLSCADTPSLLPNYLRFKETGQQAGLPAVAWLKPLPRLGLSPCPQASPERGGLQRLERPPLDFGTPDDLL